MNQLTFWLFKKRNRKFLLKELKTVYKCNKKNKLTFWQYSYELPCRSCIIATYKEWTMWSPKVSSPIEDLNDSCANICKIIFGKIPNSLECKYVHNKLLRRFGCRGMRI